MKTESRLRFKQFLPTISDAYHPKLERKFEFKSAKNTYEIRPCTLTRGISYHTQTCDFIILFKLNALVLYFLIQKVKRNCNIFTCTKLQQFY